MMFKTVIKRTLLSLFTLFILTAMVVGTFYLRWEWVNQVLDPARAEVGEEKLRNNTYRNVAEKAGKLAKAALLKYSAPALSVAVGVEGQIVWARALGFADLENKIPATLQTSFRLGSTSKSLTAAMAAKLVQEGKLDLDAPIGTYVPYLGDNLAKITSRQLLSHTAGIRHYATDYTSWPPHEFYSNEAYGSVRDSLSVFQEDPLRFQPGQGFAYSSYGFNLLSAVLEGAGGDDFLRQMKNHIFSPLAMTGTGPAKPGASPTLAGQYKTENGKYTASYPVDLSIKWAGGGFMATPSDMVRFGSGMLNQTFVNPSVRQQFFTVHKMDDGSPAPWGTALGFRAELKDLGGHETLAVHHGGGVTGGVSFYVILPDHNMVISVQANTSQGQTRRGIEDLAFQVADLFITQKITLKGNE